MSEEFDYAKAHAGLSELIDEGEVIVKWAAVIEVMGPNDTRYLAHRAGCGVDGEDSPMTWDVIGMMRSGMLNAEDQQMSVSCFDDVDDDPDAAA